MKFLETCILTIMLITQQALADGPGAAETEAADGLEQFDGGNSRADMLAQEIKRARNPRFVGKRGYYSSDEFGLSDDSQDIPLEVALQRNFLSSLLGDSSEGLPEDIDGSAQSDYFGRQIRYTPMMVGRRGQWAPKFVGKRRGPLFVGRRRSPYFVGKRTTDMSDEKRRNPMFVGKRADPVLVARGLSKPMFVGRRGHPMFVGRRTASGDLDSSIFMGKRSVEKHYTGQRLTSRRKRSIDTNRKKTAKQVNARYEIKSKWKLRKRHRDSYLTRQKRNSDFFIDKHRRNFDVPYFVGKRGNIKQEMSSITPRSHSATISNTGLSKTPNVDKRTNFDSPEFIGKRVKASNSLQHFATNRNPFNTPVSLGKTSTILQKSGDIGKRYISSDIIGKRTDQYPLSHVIGKPDSQYISSDSIGKRAHQYTSPDFIGKRAHQYKPPDFIGKRAHQYNPPDFIGKRAHQYSSPDFIGKRIHQYSSPDFIGKRAHQYSSPDFIGKRAHQYSSPDFIGKRAHQYSSPDFIGKRIHEYNSPDFIGKRAHQNSSPDLIGKRAHQYYSPDFIGKRAHQYSSPDFIGKRSRGYISPDFIGKRAERYSSQHIPEETLRGFLSPNVLSKGNPKSLPSGANPRSKVPDNNKEIPPNVQNSNINVVLKFSSPAYKKGTDFIAPDFLGKRGNTLVSDYRRIQKTNRQDEDKYSEQETYPNKLDSGEDTRFDDFDIGIQRQATDTNIDFQIDPRLFFPAQFFLSPTKFESRKIPDSKSAGTSQTHFDGYPEVKEFLPELPDEQSPKRVSANAPDDSGFAKKRSAWVVRLKNQLTFTAPEFIGKRAKARGHREQNADDLTQTLNFPHMTTYDVNADTNVLYSDVALKPELDDSPISTYSTQSSSALWSGFPPQLTFRRSPSFMSPDFIGKRPMQSGEVDNNFLDRSRDLSMVWHPFEKFQKTRVKHTMDPTSMQHSMFDNGDPASDLDDIFGVSFRFGSNDEPSAALYGGTQDRTVGNIS